MKENVYKYTLNNLIAADDLHWNDDEEKYVALSSEEIDQILINCIESDIYKESDIMHIVNWCTSVKVGQILFNNFLKKQVKIVGLDKDNEPFFESNS
jgi:hypothetical protein